MRICLTVSLLGVLLALAACGGGNTPELRRVEEGKAITVLRSDKSADLDPQSTSSGGDVRVLSLIYEQLVSASVGTPEVEWTPGLATEWKINDDHTVYTFTIRKGVKFHDGSDLNAHVVKKSLDRMIVEDHPTRPPERPYRTSYFGEVKSVDAVDDWTVRFTHKQPNPRFLSTLGLHGAMIVSPKAIDHLATISDSSARKAWLTRNPAGTGPYTIRSPQDYQSDSMITLTRFDGFWDGKPEIERIVFETQTDTRVRTQRALAGDVHFVDSLDPSDWAGLEKNEKVKLYTWRGQNLCYLAMNCMTDHKHATANRDVREAIALAIDRTPMVAKYAGRAVPHHVLIPPPMMGHPKGYKPKSDTLSRDAALARAKSLIEKAGAAGAELPMFQPDTARPYLLYPDEIANFIQQQLGAIGLKVVLNKRPMADLTPMMLKGDFALVLIGWMGDTGEPDNFWRPLLSGSNGKPAGNNNARFFNEAVAAKVDAAGTETNRGKREALYNELEKWVHDEFRPIVPLLSAEQSYAWASSLKGVIVDTTGTFHFHKASVGK